MKQTKAYEDAVGALLRAILPRDDDDTSELDLDEIREKAAALNVVRIEQLSVSAELVAGDVIQLEPENQWGPLFAIVEEVKAWGVICYFFVPGARDVPPTIAPLRVEHGKFERIGQARWCLSQ